MSLANFYEKAALAASSILKGFDPKEFAAALDSHNVAIQYDDASVHASEGRTTLELLVNLLTRLYPRLSFIPLGEKSRRFSDELRSIATSINPNITLETGTNAPSMCVVVGRTGARFTCPLIYVGSKGWVVAVSSKKPVGSGNTNNPFGAGAAACFAAANVFRALFGQQLSNAGLDLEWQLSLLDFQQGEWIQDNPPLDDVDLGETHLVGIGAIGNGTVWALSKLPKVQGSLVCVDDEQVELSNLQRYVLTTQSDQGIPKVDLAKKCFANASVTVRAEPYRWGTYLGKRNNYILDQVAVAVDSAEVRRAIQSSLPKHIVNAWTQPGDLGVSRHTFLGDQACLMCLYLPDQVQKHFDQLVAESIGLPNALMEVRNLLYIGQGLNRAFIERVAAALQVELQPLLRFEGKPLRTFYRVAVCGGVILSLTKDSPNQDVEVPMAFQSALSGILLAAELVGSKLRRHSLPTKTTIDLLKPLGSYLSFPHRKHPSGKCICQDEDFMMVYKNKYGDSK